VWSPRGVPTQRRPQLLHRCILGSKKIVSPAVPPQPPAPRGTPAITCTSWPFGSSSCVEDADHGSCATSERAVTSEEVAPLGSTSYGSLVGCGSMTSAPPLSSPNKAAARGSATGASSVGSPHASQLGLRDDLSASRSRHPWLADRLLPLDITRDPSPAPLVGHRAHSVTQAVPFQAPQSSWKPQHRLPRWV